MATLSRKVSLRGARISAGFSTKNIADMLGVTTRTVWNWETGKTHMRTDQVERFCALCGFSIYDVDFFCQPSTQIVD